MIRKLILGGSAFAVAAMALLLVTVGGSQAKPVDAHVQGIAAPAAVIEGVEVEVRILAVNGHGNVYIGFSAGEVEDCRDEDYNACNEVDAFPNFGDWQQAIIGDAGSDLDVINLEWEAPEGFPGGQVTVVACQDDEANVGFSLPVDCQGAGRSAIIQVVGSAASVELHAQRGYSNESSSSECADTPVYVIAAFEYTFNNATTFNNDRAIICAEVRDNVGHPVAGANVLWSVSGGGCLDEANNNTLFNGIVHNRLESCNTGNSGDVATVTATAGLGSDSVQVAFGGDPASCTISSDTDPLLVGDSAKISALFVDSNGNPVPDGIIAHLVLVSSGVSSENVSFVSGIEDTVQGMIHGNIISAISGLVTFAASVETIGPAGSGDATCTEAMEVSGDVHQHPGDGGILYGNQPPAGGGFGTFAFGGGTFAQLLEASGCPAATSAFFYNKPDGGWAVWIPGSGVAAVNAEIFSIFPQQHQPIPHGTIFTAKCV